MRTQLGDAPADVREAPAGDEKYIGFLAALCADDEKGDQSEHDQPDAIVGASDALALEGLGAKDVEDVGSSYIVDL